MTLILFFYSSFATAEIYKVIDENGRVVFTDQNPNGDITPTSNKNSLSTKSKHSEEQKISLLQKIKNTNLWPPKVGEYFPDLELIDHRGDEINLSQFLGKVLIIEPIGMTCPACNGWSGAIERGGFKGIRPQKNLQAIEKSFPKYTNGIKLDHKNIIFIQLLLYDLTMGPPKPRHAKNWAEHFGLDKQPNTYVTVPREDMRNNASYTMIPGFFLVDKDFVLRSDATGHHPHNNLWTHLLPMVPGLLN